MSIKNSQYRSISTRIHDYMLYQFISILKSSSLGQNYIGGGKAYYFSENRQPGQLSLCDCVLDDGEEFLHIEMKTKIIDEYKHDILAPIKKYILEQAINREILKTKFIVVVGLYTDSQRAAFNFRDSKYLILYGDSGNYNWSKPRSLEYWMREFVYVRDICSLFTQIKLDSSGSSQIAIPQIKENEASLPGKKKRARQKKEIDVVRAKELLSKYRFTYNVVGDLLGVNPNLLKKSLKNFNYTPGPCIKAGTISLLIIIGYNEKRSLTFDSLSSISNVDIFILRDRVMSLIKSEFILMKIKNGSKLNTSIRRVSSKDISDDQEFSFTLTPKAHIFSNTKRFKELLNENSAQ